MWRAHIILPLLHFVRIRNSPLDGLALSLPRALYYIYYLTRKGSFSIGGVRFAAVTNDVLFHFVRQDTARFPSKATRPERMVRLVRHLLQQRSLCVSQLVLLRAALAWLAAPESDLDERGLEFVQSFGFLCSRLGARMRMPLPLVPALALGIPARIQSRRPRPCV